MQIPTPTNTIVSPEELREDNDTDPDDAAASKTGSPSTGYMSVLPLYVAVPLALVALLTLSVLVLHQFQVRKNKIRHYSNVTRSTIALDDDDDDDNDDNNDEESNQMPSRDGMLVA